MLRLIERAARGDASARSEPAPNVARAAAAEAIVLLQNANILPLEQARIRRVAVIGPQAARSAVQGGGSAEVTPTYVVNPLEAIRQRAGGEIQVTYDPGCLLPGPTPVLDHQSLWTAPGGDAGMVVEVFAASEPNGAPVMREVLSRSIVRWGGSPAPGILAGHFSARATGEFVPDSSGTWEFGLASAGQARLWLDDRLLAVSTEPDLHYRAGSTEVTAAVDLECGSSHRFAVDFSVDSGREMVGMRFGARLRPPVGAVGRAAQAARDADVAIVVVGYDGGWESEGADRPSLSLPGDQDELVRAVAAANSRTVVVLNAGAPVAMPWTDEVAAIVHLWFPGMEGGNALADVLFGDVDASGRLPTTFPRRLEDCPAYPYYPGEDGVVRYAEGLLVGYRHYDRADIAPRFCFGHGMSYTRFAYANLLVSTHDPGAQVFVDVTNVGERAGQEVVQLYVRDPSAPQDRPERELREFAKKLGWRRGRPGPSGSICHLARSPIGIRTATPGRYRRASGKSLSAPPRVTFARARV